MYHGIRNEIDKSSVKFIDVFVYNERAINFYNKNGYHSRMITNIKKL